MTYVTIYTAGGPGIPSVVFIPNSDTKFYSIYTGNKISRPSYETPSDDTTGGNEKYCGGIFIGDNQVMCHHVGPHSRN